MHKYTDKDNDTKTQTKRHRHTNTHTHAHTNTRTHAGAHTHTQKRKNRLKDRQTDRQEVKQFRASYLKNKPTKNRSNLPGLFAFKSTEITGVVKRLGNQIALHFVNIGHVAQELAIEPRFVFAEVALHLMVRGRK